MAFILHADRLLRGPESMKIVRESWQAYEEYIHSVRHSMPPGALRLFNSSSWYNPSAHECPHDSRLNECRIIEVEPDPGGPKPCYCSLEVKLRGGFGDGMIGLRYPRLFSYNIQSSDCTHGIGDWLYDEFRLSERGNLLHEIEWADGGRWLIEADDIEFIWQPFETEPA